MEQPRDKDGGRVGAMKIDVADAKDIDDSMMSQVMYMDCDANACYASLDANNGEHIICALPASTLAQFKRTVRNEVFLLKTRAEKGKRRLIGMAGLSTLTKHTLLLHTVYVKPAHRRKGICTAILKRAMSIAKTQGKRLVLDVNPLNYIALKLYMELGFTPAKSQTIRMEAQL